MVQATRCEMKMEIETETEDVTETESKKKKNFDLLLIAGLLGGWFLIQAYVLPGLGVST